MEFLRQLASCVILPNALATLIGVPSAVLYLLEVLVICFHRHGHPQFNSSFFHLFLARALPSIFNMVSSYWGHRFCLLGLFFHLYQRMPSLLLNFFIFVSFYTYHVENLSTSCLLLNRFTSITSPMSYDAIWRKWLPLAYLMIFGLPIAVTWPIFGVEMEVYFVDSTSNAFGYMKPNLEFPCSLFLAYSGALFLTICVLLNVASWLAYRRKFAKISNAAKGQIATGLISKMELHMFLYVFSTFVCQLIMAGLYLCLYLASHYEEEDKSPVAGLFVEILFNWYGLVNDTCTVVVPAWLLLFSSAKMREILSLPLVQLREWLVNSLASASWATRTTAMPAAAADDGTRIEANNFVSRIHQ